MTKKPLIIVLALLACLVLPLCTGCNGCGKQSGETPADTTAVATGDSVASDSTIYGTSDEFGMSTFSLIADSTGDTLCVTRTASDGTDGQIWGDLDEGSRYALTTREWSGCSSMVTRTVSSGSSSSMSSGHSMKQGAPE